MNDLTWWQSLWQRVSPQLPKNYTVFFGATLATALVSNYFGKALSMVWPKVFPDLQWGTEAIFGLCVASVIEYSLRMRGKVSSRLNELDGRLRATHRAAELAECYYQIAVKRFSPAVEEEIRDLSNAPKEDELGGDFLSNAIDLAKQWKENVEAHDRWRLLMHILLNSELNSVRTNNFSMPLKTYLRILLTSIDLASAVAERKKEKLVIASFTNALPSDWFGQSNPVVGESMEDYADELARRMNVMRKKKHSYRRYVLCSPGLTDRGFEDRAGVEQDWSRCSREDRETYLSRLHTSEEDAHIVELYPEIEFTDKFTELIYFGFQKQGSANVNWEWCYACAYTHDNRNVSAQFVNLATDGTDALIDVRNKHERRYGGLIAPPEHITLSFGAFPDYFEYVAQGTVRIKNLIPLARKWDIASQVWHGDHEEKLLTGLFGQILQPGATILDCACGTGFHSLLLHNAGFKVTATDLDDDNTAIMQEKMKKSGITIDVDTIGWLDLPTRLLTRYDCVACLGSSITYYESWDENVHKLGNRATFRDVVKSLKSMLNPNGTLVIGASRHYDSRLTGHSTRFMPKRIGEQTYQMEWTLTYDWSELRKMWECKITEVTSGDDYSFYLISHLIDLTQLMDLCRKFFSDVRCVDLDNSFYDVFIICSDRVTGKC